MQTVPISYFSDVLCVWAYVAQVRIDAIQAEFGERVRFEPRFCSVFGDTARKIATAWKDRDGYAGFNKHLRHVGTQFPEIPLHPDLWLTVRPASSASPHLALKAVQLLEAGGEAAEGDFDAATIAFRKAFFVQARDIGRRGVQADILRETGIDADAVETLVEDGRAFAALSSDYADADAMHIQGSPSFVLNEGRQKLYGNVGFRVMEANIAELLREPVPDQASWC